MENGDFTRREFIKGTAAACGAMLIGDALPGMPASAGAAAGQPIPPIKMTYYSNYQEIVEFFKKAAEDFRNATVAGNTPFTPLMKPWHNPNLPAPEYSIDKARDLLKKAGYTWNSDGKLCFPTK